MKCPPLQKLPTGTRPIYWEHFAKNIMLPIYLGLTHWVIKNTGQAPYILFFSRDGYLLYKVLRALKENLLLPKTYTPTLAYLPISRRYIQFTYTAHKNNYKRFKKIALSKIIRFSDYSIDPSSASKLFNYYQRQAKLYARFLKTNFNFPNHIYTFEIGWRGTTVKYFSLFLSEVYPKPPSITPLYYGSLVDVDNQVHKIQKTYAIKDSQPRELTKFIESYTLLFEFLFSAPYGRLQGLNTALVPQWQKIAPNHKKAYKIIEKTLTKAILVHVKNSQHFWRAQMCSPDKLIKPFQTFARTKRYEDLKVFSKLHIEIDPGAILTPFVPNFTKQRFLSTPKKKIQELMQMAPWSNTLFVKDVTKSEFYDLLKQRRLLKQLYKDWTPSLKSIIKLFLNASGEITRILLNPPLVWRYLKTLVSSR